MLTDMIKSNENERSESTCKIFKEIYWNDIGKFNRLCDAADFSEKQAYT